MPDRYGDDPVDLDSKRAHQAAAREALTHNAEPTVADRVAAIVECGRCDDDGYAGTRVCDHQTHASPETREAAKAIVRAALAKQRADHPQTREQPVSSPSVAHRAPSAHPSGTPGPAEGHKS